MKLIYKDLEFICEENEAIKITLTDKKIINKAIKPLYEDGIEIETDCLGKWTYDLEKDSTIYFMLFNDDIIEFIGYNDKDETKYIININDEIIPCIIEEGDEIFETYKDAKLELLSKLNTKIEQLL